MADGTTPDYFLRLADGSTWPRDSLAPLFAWMRSTGTVLVIEGVATGGRLTDGAVREDGPVWRALGGPVVRRAEWTVRRDRVQRMRLWHEPGAREAPRLEPFLDWVRTRDPAGAGEIHDGRRLVRTAVAGAALVRLVGAWRAAGAPKAPAPSRRGAVPRG